MVRFSNGQAVAIAIISNEIRTVCNPTSFWPFEIQTSRISDPHCILMPDSKKYFYFNFLRIVLVPSTDPLSNDIQNVLMHPGDENGGGVAMEIDNIGILRS